MFLNIKFIILQACNKASNMCGITYDSMTKFVKEKVFARFVVDNKSLYIKKTAHEKLTDNQIHIIRQEVFTLCKFRNFTLLFGKKCLQVHQIFRKCSTKKKKDDPMEDIPFPTIRSIHQTLMRHPALPKKSLGTYRTILKSMGFRYYCVQRSK